jgi:hypothetical protein
MRLGFTIIFQALCRRGRGTDVNLNPSDKLTRSAICVVSLIVALSLSLNFFPSSGSCPMKCGVEKTDMTGCNCCPLCRAAAHHTMSGKTANMSCCRGMCHVEGSGVSTPRTNTRGFSFLKQRTVDSGPLNSAQLFRDYKANLVSFLFDKEKDRPPEIS